jgi:hypothetical protein
VKAFRPYSFKCLFIAIWILLVSLLWSGNAFTQNIIDTVGRNSDSVWVEIIKSKLHSLIAVSVISPSMKKDSLGKLQIDSLEKNDSIIDKKAPLIAFKQGYIQYNLNYRSYIDTPYAEGDIFQHIGMVNADFVIAGTVPITVNYFERQSNSELFRDFRDVRADINGPELRRLQLEKLRRELRDKIHSLEDKATLGNLNVQRKNQDDLRGLLKNPKLIELLIQSKENIINLEERDPSFKWRDSIEIYSQKYISLYESREKDALLVEKKIDSLREVYLAARKKMQNLQALVNRQMDTKDGLYQLRKALQDSGMQGKRRGGFSGFLYSMRRVSLGRTVPDFSPLTLKNINVKGINTEFGNNWWYAAFCAGIVDFRLRDFVHGNKKQPTQSVYAAKAGIGSREGTHIFFTGYKGRKQLYSFNKPSSEVVGVGTELQYVWKKYHLFTAEIAQSSVPSNAVASEGKDEINFKDRTASAYNLQWRSYFPGIKARAEGFYQKTGVNFQSFNSYRVNAATESWSLRYEQYFFKRQLRINAGVRKNDYENPLIGQNYKSNTIFKTLHATFKKRKWPSISVGYIPSSQYVIIDSLVYESRYQTLTTNINHSYKIGIASALTNAFYSKFYNSGSDSGFVYFNAQHVSIYQQLMFLKHSGTLGVTITRSRQFTLSVYQIGAGTVLRKKIHLEFGTKINRLDNDIMKVGIYGRSQVKLPFVGDISLWYDDGYLPGIGKQLIKNQQMNIGFTRRIK